MADEQRYVLTRDTIRSGYVRQLIEELGLEMRVLSEDELADSLSRTLAGADLSQGVWVFGYGSLIWNPACHFDRRRTGRIHGYHRRFCLWTHLGRGNPQCPGLVLGLERGGSCHGVALRIAPEQVQDELGVIWAREMISGAYTPRWVTVHGPEGPVRAVAFVINRAHERYARYLPDEQIAEVISTAGGSLGPCADYLINTVDHLNELGIRDRALERLRDRVVVLKAARAGTPERSVEAQAT